MSKPLNHVFEYAFLERCVMSDLIITFILLLTNYLLF